MGNQRALHTVLITLILSVGATLSPKMCVALPIDVELIHSTYTTYVSASIYYAPRVDTSRTQSSPMPSSDQLYAEYALSPTFIDTAEGAADAALFEVSVFGLTGTNEMAAQAYAQSEYIFSPLINGTANIGIDIHRAFDYVFTNGFIILSDITLNQELWNYHWSQEATGVSDAAGNIPWVNNGLPYGPDADFLVDTYITSDHTYILSMLAGMSSNHDIEVADIKVSGLNIVSVPEPSTIFLVGLALVTIAGLMWKDRTARASSNSKFRK